MAMSNLGLRVLSALVLAPILVVVVVVPHPLPFLLLVLLASGICLWEWGRMTLGTEALAERIFGIFVGVGTAAVVCLGDAQLILAGTTALVLLAFGWFLFRYGDLTTAPQRVGTTIAGALYGGLLLSFLFLLKKRPEGPHGEWVLLAMTIAWLGDTFAYFTGRAFGKHKLYKAISPGKTVEGGLGGLLGSVLAVVIARYWYLSGFIVWWDCLVLGVGAGAVGQVGDLCESLVKRAYGFKDSGSIMPGHGGLLDRVDALLFVGPAVYFYALLRFGG